MEILNKNKKSQKISDMSCEMKITREKILVLMLILTWQACKPVDDSVVQKSSDAIAAERRKLLEKILLDYLQRLKKARIEQVIDPHQDQNFEVTVRDTQVYGSKTLTQVSWNRVTADKIEVLRCELLNKDESDNTCNARSEDFAELVKESNASACGYRECKRVREKIHDGTKLIDHSIIATFDNTDEDANAKRFHYLVRPCFENYLLVGKGKSETLVKCGADAIKNSNANSASGRYLAQRACGEGSLLICGKPSLSKQYTRGEGITFISKELLGLYDKREKLIADLEELAEKMVLEAQAGLQESLKWEDMPREARIAKAKQELQKQNLEKYTDNAQSLCPEEPEGVEEEDKSLWEHVTGAIKDPVFWQLVASAPFSAITEAPECYQAQEYAEKSYAADVSERIGEGAVSDEGRKMARNQGYIECAEENIGTLIDYHKLHKSGEKLTAYDASAILDAGISMIPLPNSELNSRSTQEAVFMSLNTLLSDPPKLACDYCPTCLKHTIKLRTYEQQRRKLNIDLRTTITLIQGELTSKGIKDPYAETNN